MDPTRLTGHVDASCDRVFRKIDNLDAACVESRYLRAGCLEPLLQREDPFPREPQIKEHVPDEGGLEASQVGEDVAVDSLQVQLRRGGQACEAFLLLVVRLHAETPAQLVRIHGAHRRRQLREGVVELRDFDFQGRQVERLGPFKVVRAIGIVTVRAESSELASLYGAEAEMTSKVAGEPTRPDSLARCRVVAILLVLFLRLVVELRGPRVGIVVVVVGGSGNVGSIGGVGVVVLLLMIQVLATNGSVAGIVVSCVRSNLLVGSLLARLGRAGFDIVDLAAPALASSEAVVLDRSWRRGLRCESECILR